MAHETDDPSRANATGPYQNAVGTDGTVQNNTTENQPAEEPLKQNTVAALDFLSRMFDNQNRHLVAIVPDGELTAKTFSAQDEAGVGRWIDEKHGNAGLYYAVNRLKTGFHSQKATKADVAAALFLHTDVDDLGALNRIRAFEPPPTVVVCSGGGYQGLWRLNSPNTDLAKVEKINRAIGTALQADHCHNIDRLLRVPGTLNIPNAKKRANGRVPALAYVVDELSDWTRAWSLEDFSHLPPPPEKRSAKHDLGSIRPVQIDDLPAAASEMVRDLIVHGDDLTRPIGGANPRFASRSEAVWRVACVLTKAGCSKEMIAGVLVNPNYGISGSILEKRDPAAYALRQALRAQEVTGSDWPNRDRCGNPKATLRNAKLGMLRLGLEFSSDEFRQRKFVHGQVLQEYLGELTDDRCTALRNLVLERFGFDPGREHTLDALNVLCLENQHHPIREYLSRIEWDGDPRLGSLLHRYFGAEDTQLNFAISRAMLIAAVRRVRQPGCKFDTIPVLEGVQGTGKSTGLQILAGAENFSDNEILALDSKAQMEAIEGIWIYEFCELEGLSRADTSRVKAFASRQIDRARPAYARFREDRPRQCIFVGTTNDDKYLRDLTGNRRWWPVRTGAVDLAALQADRDQLWAEAAYWEAKGESILLADWLWPDAAREQEARLEDDPWTETLATVEEYHFVVQCDDHYRVKTKDLFDSVLSIPKDRLQQYHTKRLAGLMRKLGWEGPSAFRFGDDVARGYQRPIDPAAATEGSPIDQRSQGKGPERMEL